MELERAIRMTLRFDLGMSPDEARRLAEQIRPGVEARLAEDQARSHTEGLRVAQAWARYWIGDGAWAAGVVEAYRNPERMMAELQEEMREGA
jgi:hypothetical protein